jgi:hypothetical protein
VLGAQSFPHKFDDVVLGFNDIHEDNLMASQQKASDQTKPKTKNNDATASSGSKISRRINLNIRIAHNLPACIVDERCLCSALEGHVFDRPLTHRCGGDITEVEAEAG